MAKGRRGKAKAPDTPSPLLPLSIDDLDGLTRGTRFDIADENNGALWNWLNTRSQIQLREWYNENVLSTPPATGPL